MSADGTPRRTCFHASVLARAIKEKLTLRNIRSVVRSDLSPDANGKYGDHKFLIPQLHFLHSFPLIINSRENAKNENPRKYEE